MKILVLNYLPYSASPLDKIYDSSNENVVVLSSDHVSDSYDQSNYLYFQSFENYVDNELVMLKAIELYQIYHFDFVVALHEFDMIRAARLREYLGIEGQQPSSVYEFRNKWIMKQKLRKNGISVANMDLIDSSLKLDKFIKEQGYPVVVKPLDGLGSIHTYVLHDQKEFEEFLTNKFPTQLLAEKYVEGDYFHIDGWIENGEVKLMTVSKYHNVPLTSSHMTHLGSLMLHPRNPLAKRLVEGTKRVLDILNTPLHTTFHAEWFHTPDDQIVFGEIGSRTGGGKISDSHKLVYDCPLFDVHAKITAGLPVPTISEKRKSDLELLSGFVLVNTRSGTLGMKEEMNFPDWIKITQITGEDGGNYNEAVLSIDTIAQFVFIGKDEQQLESRFHELIKLVNKKFHWET